MSRIKSAEDIVARITEHIQKLLEDKEFVIVAIDGRCASGKTTLAEKLQEKLSCNVIHGDEFFLRPNQRTVERLSVPGGNVDYERLLEEVILPLRENRDFTYRPYDCKTCSLKEPVQVKAKRITIIEGSYSCHPYLWEYYNLRIFLTIDKKTQRERIQKRNAENAEVFFEKWIPLEEAYFKAYAIEERCDKRI